MKSNACIIAILAVYVLAAESATAATKVFLLGGQSNMAGVGITSDLTTPYNAIQTTVKLWNSWNDTSAVGDGWLNLQGGYGFPYYSGLSMYGPEVSFGYALDHTILPNDEIYLVKLGANSTSLANQWNPNGGYIYSYFKSRVNEAMKNLTTAGKLPQIAGMIWMQGESDAMNHTYATAYQTNLTNFITKVRTEFLTPFMPFVVGRINNSSEWGTTDDRALVRTAQATVPAQVGHASWINTDNIAQWTGNESGHYDPGHYSSQGQINLGIDFANKFVQTPEPSALVLMATGMMALAGYLWRRRRLAFQSV